MIDDGELGNKTENGLDGYNGDNEKTPEGKKKDDINSEASEDEQENDFMMLRTLAIKVPTIVEKAHEKRKKGEKTKDELKLRWRLGCIIPPIQKGRSVSMIMFEALPQG